MQPEMRQLTGRRWRRSRPLLLAGLAMLCVGLMVVGPVPLQAASQITEVLLGDKADANGVVEQHRNTFSPTTAEIKGTAFIAGADKGKKVIVELTYLPKNLKVLTMTEDLPGGSEATFTFTFPKPERGWPKGDYMVVISTSDGASKVVSFQVK